LKKDELKKTISLPKRRTAEESVDSLRGKIMKFIDMENLRAIIQQPSTNIGRHLRRIWTLGL